MLTDFDLFISMMAFSGAIALLAYFTMPNRLKKWLLEEEDETV